ncbi:MAG TPA: hypothetical protein VFN03_07445 [Trueperaceae bacterium]|nr:hypothetical protein [Trueperaceae bacterium]
MFVKIAAVFVIAVCSTGLAQPVQYAGVPGGDAWLAGDFATAYREASQVDSAAAQLLASRAAADQAVYLEDTAAAATDWLDLADTAARRSLELEPAGPLAAASTMAVARAKGEAGLHRGALANARLPGELRTLFERTLELDPDNADALVAYGAWHFALTELGVGWLYGANRADVLPLVERGVAAAPRQLNLRVEYARVLLALDRAADARVQIDQALATPAVTAADRFEQARARELLTAP